MLPQVIGKSARLVSALAGVLSSTTLVNAATRKNIAPSAEPLTQERKED